MFSQTFLKDMIERAVSTFAQSFLALIGTDGVGLLSINVVDSLVASLVAALLSALKAFANANRTV